MDEEGKVGEGRHVEGLGGGKEGLGKLATVWDGEVVGMRGGTQSALEDRRVLRILLSDSQAAIAAVRKAGQTGLDPNLYSFHSGVTSSRSAQNDAHAK